MPDGVDRGVDLEGLLQVHSFESSSWVSMSVALARWPASQCAHVEACEQFARAGIAVELADGGQDARSQHDRMALGAPS